MNVLDATGRPIPKADIARVRMRASLTGPVGGLPYDAAEPTTQAMGAWHPSLRSPDDEINAYRNRMVGRTRDLVRNDGYARGLIDRMLDSAVGASFSPVPRPNWRVLQRQNKAMDATWAAEFAEAVRGEWQLWAEDPACHCDAERLLTVPQMFRLALRHKLVDGDGVLALLWAPERVGRGAARYSTTLQIIDPDRLSNPYDQMDTQEQRGGVRIDALGAPIGYHIRRGHPTDWYAAATSMIWDFLPRETPWGRPVVVHDFERERAGQHRGVGILTPVLPQFRQRARMSDLAIAAAVLRSMFNFFVKSPYDAEQIQQAMTAGGDIDNSELSQYQAMREDWHTKNTITVGGVRVPILAPGESMETVQGGDRSTDYQAFQQDILQLIAMNTSQSYEEGSGDFSKTNYSSYRGASQISWRAVMRRRADFAVNTAMPVYSAFLEEALDGDRLKNVLPANAPDFLDYRAAYVGAQWIGPGRGWIDIEKEAAGELLKLHAGMTTLADVTSNVSGAHWQDVLDQREVEQEAMSRRKMALPEWIGPARDTRDTRDTREKESP